MADFANADVSLDEIFVLFLFSIPSSLNNSIDIDVISDTLDNIM